MRILPTRRLDDLAGEDLGNWDFSTLPRAGDHVDIVWNEKPEIILVERVVHFAVQNPLPRSETPFRQRKAPSICIIGVRAS